MTHMPTNKAGKMNATFVSYSGDGELLVKSQKLEPKL